MNSPWPTFAKHCSRSLFQYLWVCVRANRYQVAAERSSFSWHFYLFHFVFTRYSLCEFSPSLTQTGDLTSPSQLVLRWCTLWTTEAISTYKCLGLILSSPCRASGWRSDRNPCHWVLCMRNGQVQTHLLRQLVWESSPEGLPKWVHTIVMDFDVVTVQHQPFAICVSVGLEPTTLTSLVKDRHPGSTAPPWKEKESPALLSCFDKSKAAHVHTNTQ